MKAILNDITKCIGCAECVNACKVANSLSKDLPRDWQKDDGLSAVNWTSVLRYKGKNVRKQCRHCNQPACAEVCPVGALHKTESGAVVYDSNKCLGCRYCMMACPYGIPRYEWQSAVPYVRKCILCYDNIKSGKLKEPACTSTCPTGAAKFGTRADLLKEAKKRISDFPKKYTDKVIGETENGGTNVLYLTASGFSLDFLYYGRKFSDEPVPTNTKYAMGAVPYAFLGMGALMSGIYWISKRKDKIKSEMNNSAENILKNIEINAEGRDDKTV